MQGILHLFSQQKALLADIENLEKEGERIDQALAMRKMQFKSLLNCIHELKQNEVVEEDEGVLEENDD